MSLIFKIEQKPKYKPVTVFDVEIPLLGEITVDEAIGMDKAIVKFVKGGTNTEYQIARTAGWLSARLNCDMDELAAQLKSSMPLLSALWDVCYNEWQSLNSGYELDEPDEPVAEGKEEPTVPLKTSKKSGTKSTSSSQDQDSPTNSVLTLDLPESA
jgi:hypothetical protein